MFQVDCVVIVGDDDQNNYHPMSYTTFHSPVLAGEIRSPIEDSSRLPLSERKVIARRAARLLKPGLTVNLGIGLPEGVASVAGEEGMLPYITLTTEPGKKTWCTSDRLEHRSILIACYHWNRLVWWNGKFRS